MSGQPANGSPLEEATARVAAVRSQEGFLLTSPFLDLCRTVLPVVGEQRRCILI
jgi:hypothetical protein